MLDRVLQQNLGFRELLAKALVVAPELLALGREALLFGARFHGARIT
jgi:hypothetical protein